MKNEKEYYRLWWEYLKRSDSYQRFCNWFRERKKDPNFPLPEEFKKTKNGVAHFVAHYRSFVSADCGDFTFEDWWKWKKEAIEKDKDWRRKNLVHDFCTFIEKDIHSFINDFKRENGREPTLLEYRDSFKDFQKNSALNTHYLIIEIMFDKPKELLRELEKILKEKIKTKSNKRYFDELRRYLAVYDLWKETDEKGKKLFTMKAIIKKLGDKSQKAKAGDINVQRAFRSDLAKAKKIIKNVESGIFPGKYP